MPSSFSCSHLGPKISAPGVPQTLLLVDTALFLVVAEPFLVDQRQWGLWAVPSIPNSGSYTVVTGLTPASSVFRCAVSVGCVCVPAGFPGVVLISMASTLSLPGPGSRVLLCREVGFSRLPFCPSTWTSGDHQQLLAPWVLNWTCAMLSQVLNP